jgi:hypothetical protein
VSDLFKLTYHGDDPADLYDLSKKWGISMERLQYLAKCPTNRSKTFIPDYDKFTGQDRTNAVCCRLIFRQGWTHYEAAKKLGMSANKLTRWLNAKGIVWPDGCKRKATWGGRAAAMTRMEGNLLGSTKANDPDASPVPGRIKRGSGKEYAYKAKAEGLTLSEASRKYGINICTLFCACKKYRIKLPKGRCGPTSKK